MRRLIGAIVLAIFAFLNAIDGVCCPDGCTHGQDSPAQQHRSNADDGICMLCLGGVESSVRLEWSPCGLVTHRVAAQATPAPLDIPPDPVEHPPRT